METLTIEKGKAIIAYQNADQPGKQLLKDLFGSKVLADRMEAVKTFEDACEVLGIDPCSSLPSVDHLSVDGRSIMAYAKLTIIARALNDGWKPDWSDYNQYKYVPWFESRGSASGLASYDFDDWCSITDVGSRLCYKTADLARYAGKQFEDLYNEFIIL